MSGPSCPFPSPSSLLCQSWSQPPSYVLRQHSSTLSPPTVIPFSGHSVTKINKRKKSERISEQPLFLRWFLCTFFALFCEAAGLTRTSGGLFKVRMSNSSSGSCNEQGVGGEKKKKRLFKNWKESNNSYAGYRLCDFNILLSSQQARLHIKDLIHLAMSSCVHIAWWKAYNVRKSMSVYNIKTSAAVTLWDCHSKFPKLSEFHLRSSRKTFITAILEPQPEIYLHV